MSRITRRQEHRRVRVRQLSAEEKAAIAERCEAFLQTVLRPKCLPVVRPTPFNYPIALFGKWRGNKYSFITRYCSGFPENLGKKFDSAFTRLDHLEDFLEENRFNVMWHRHTGQWLPVHESVSLDDALRLIETDELLHPL